MESISDSFIINAYVGKQGIVNTIKIPKKYETHKAEEVGNIEKRECPKNL